jgi:hypothetical protein
MVYKGRQEALGAELDQELEELEGADDAEAGAP